jgi:hypothetical protein
MRRRCAACVVQESLAFNQPQMYSLGRITTHPPAMHTMLFEVANAAA